jgi:hypothetical protein
VPGKALAHAFSMGLHENTVSSTATNVYMTVIAMTLKTATRNFWPGNIRRYITPSDSLVQHVAILYSIWAAKNHCRRQYRISY